MPGSMASSVQSAVRPVCTRTATCGMSVRPVEVAAASRTLGWYVLIRCTSTLPYVSQVKFASRGSWMA